MSKVSMGNGGFYGCLREPQGVSAWWKETPKAQLNHFNTHNTTRHCRVCFYAFVGQPVNVNGRVPYSMIYFQLISLVFAIEELIKSDLELIGCLLACNPPFFATNDGCIVCSSKDGRLLVKIKFFSGFMELTSPKVIIFRIAIRISIMRQQ